MEDRELTLRDGVLAGVLAGVTVAVFFFFVDVFQARPFRTPSFLASALLGRPGAEAGPGLIAAFTAFHLVAFAGLGAAAVRLFRWTEIPLNPLTGAVYGLAVCTLLFYGSLLVTGASVLPAPWWPAVLVGNLLAGLVMGGYLHWIGPEPGVTGVKEQLRLHRTVKEGLVAGGSGGLAVAAWFLIADLALREVLFTPAALGSALFLGAVGPAEVQITAGTVLGYTAVHFAAFFLFGFVLSGLVMQAEKFPPFVFAVVMILVVFELFFVGMVAMLGTWLLEELAWWSVLGGNLLAAAVMGGYLWRVHPLLREEIRTDAMWAE